MGRIPNYFENSKGSKFSAKNEEQKKTINEALHILSKLGIPLNDKTPRDRERMALAFLAVLDVKTSRDWPSVKDKNDGRSLKTRDIISYINDNFEEKISSGSYDDIRRKDLKHPVMAEIVVHTRPGSARNDPNRGYALNPEYSRLMKSFDSDRLDTWEKEADQFLSGRTTLSKELSAERDIEQIAITIPSGKKLLFSPGEHNKLIKDIIEKFLPRFGFGAEVLYVGDAAKKLTHVEKDILEELKFFELSHGELPDVVAYSRDRNWLFLIEAVYTSNPISPERHFLLQRLTSACKADVVFVSAFPNREIFRKFSIDISWETEVWIADSPDHMVHYNGPKFLGPYSRKR